MDFLTAFKEATRQGLTKEEFLKIWHLEMEFKNAAARNTTGAQGAAQAQTYIQQPTKEPADLILQIKRELMEQNQTQHQEIMQHLEHISSQLSVILTEVAKNGIHGLEIYDEHPGMTSAGLEFNKEPCLVVPQPQQSNLQRIASVGSENWVTDSDSASVTSSVYLQEEGSVLKIRRVDRLIANGSKVASPVLLHSSCPCKVQLSMWFSKTGEVNAQLSIYGLYNESLKVCRYFNVTGFILNKNSGSYSPLFEGNSVAMRHLRPDKEMMGRPATFCLKTATGSFEDVTFNELKKRGFVHEKETVFIKWTVSSPEVD